MRRLHELHEDHHHHRRGPHGHGRHRARRGALGMAILTLLDERPMHGYELITVLEERSGGRWKPSPGAIYPALGKLEERGLVTSTEQDGKRQYELTEAGRTRRRRGRSERALAPRGSELERRPRRLAAGDRRAGRARPPDRPLRHEHADRGGSDQVIKDATAKLYKILADGPSEPTPDESHD